MTNGLRVAALVKQVPAMERLELGPDNRLRRAGLELEMNPYCRRAVAKAAEIARTTGGSSTVFTLGPPSAEDVLREAIAWGIDEGRLVTDPAFAGSDTLATARALSAALVAEGSFDLVLVGQNSVDGDTGQVGPQIAQLLDLAFVGPVRELELSEGHILARCQREGGWTEVTVALPAVLSVAERLCDPAKVPPDGRAAVDPSLIRTLSARDLGLGPWGEAASRTVVGATRTSPTDRAKRKISGDPVELALAVAAAIRDLGPLGGAGAQHAAASVLDRGEGGDELVVVLAEPDRELLTRQLLGKAGELAHEIDGRVAVVSSSPTDADRAWGWGADLIVGAGDDGVPENVAATVAPWLQPLRHPVVLAPGTIWGREVASRLAAHTDSGLIGDAVELEISEGRLVGWKPAFHGALLAAITATSPIQMATVRPGVLAVLEPRSGGDGRTAETSALAPVDRGRVTVRSVEINDDPDALALAPVVIGVGQGVPVEAHPLLEPLREILGAEIGASRKVTDRGWLPHSRQIGVTGSSIAPRLYLAIGTKGNFNHMAGVRNAEFVIGVNIDPEVPLFDFCDLGVVADWRDLLPRLVEELRNEPAIGFEPRPPC